MESKAPPLEGAGVGGRLAARVHAGPESAETKIGGSITLLTKQVGALCQSPRRSGRGIYERLSSV